jgi:hypothetical protein
LSKHLVQEHADVVARLRLLADILSARQVADAFVASLGSRLLEPRSALGSFAFARVLPEHPLTPRPGTFGTICSLCGWSRMPPGHEKQDQETAQHMATERRQWGGVRHLDPQYALIDLTEFRGLDAAEPSDEDWRRLDLILLTPALLAPDAKAADLERAIQSTLSSNKNERQVLIQLLGYSGVLEAPEHPSFFDEYVPPDARDLPRQRFADWGYPVIWWRARHGIRADAVAFWFPRSAVARAG